MLGHEGLRAGVEVVDEDHGVVGEGLGREHLLQCLIVRLINIHFNVQGDTEECLKPPVDLDLRCSAILSGQ